MTPIRINQQDYKKAALDIQRNFDEISKRLLTVSRPLNVSSRVAELMIDSSLAIDGNGRLYVNGDTVLSPILTALSGLTYASGSPLIRMTGASAFILDTATYLTTIPAHTLDGALHTVSGENPGTPSTETNFSFGAVGHFNLTTIACGDFGHYTWTVQDTVSAGHETIAWTPGNVVISCEADVSTVAQVIAAAGGITGTPWAILTQSIAGVFVDPHALPFTGTLGAFPDFTAGTPGYFLKALSATTFGFAPHNLSYNDVHAAPAFVSAAANLFWATPNGASGVPSLRAIVAADIPALSYDASGAAAAAVNGTANTLAMFTATHVVRNSIVTQPTAIALTFTPTAANNLTINHAVSTGYAAIYQITGAEVTRFSAAGQTLYGSLATYYRDAGTYINSNSAGVFYYVATTSHNFRVSCGVTPVFKIDINTSARIGILDTNNTYYTYFQGSGQGADITYTLPAAPPTINYQYLSSTTAGIWSWRTAAQTLADIGASPAFSLTQYYYPYVASGGTTLSTTNDPMSLAASSYTVSGYQVAIGGTGDGSTDLIVYANPNNYEAAFTAVASKNGAGFYVAAPTNYVAGGYCIATNINQGTTTQNYIGSLSNRLTGAATTLGLYTSGVRIGTDANTTAPTRAFDLGTSGNSITFGDHVETGTAERGIYWYSGNGYGIYRSSGAWSAPNYIQMQINWTTGIVINGGTGYPLSGISLRGDHLWIPALSTAGILHNAVTTGLISSSLIVAADVTNNTLTNTQLANLVAVGTIPMGATYGLTASAITQAAGKVSIGTAGDNPFNVGLHASVFTLGSDAYFVNNLYYDGGWKYSLASQVANALSLDGGQLDYYTAPVNSGGGGAAATITDRFTILNTGLVGIGCTPAAGSTLAIGGTNAAVTVAYCDNPTVTDPYTYTPICSRVEFHSAGIVNVTLAAGSLAEGTIIVCTRDNASSYVIVNGHDLSGAHGAAFFIKTHDNGWQCICGA